MTEAQGSTQEADLSPVLTYAIALGTPLAAALARFALAPSLHGEAPLLLFVVAIMATAWYGGLRPGLLATLLSALLGTYLFIEPVQSLWIDNTIDRVHITIFIVVGVLISWFCENLHSARHRLESERRRLEEALALIHTLVGSAPIGMAFVDREMRYRLINPPLAEINGIAAEAHLGRTVAEVVPTLAPTAAQWFRQVVDTGRPIVEHELCGETAKAPGLKRYWLESWYPVRTPTQEVLGVGVIVQDITARKQAKQALQEANRRKDEFLATLAHELRNPLAPIRNALHILRLAGNDATRREQARTLMERQVHQLVRLIDDLLDVSRITRGKIVLRQEWVDLATVVHQAVETSQPLIEAMGHQLALKLPPEPLRLEADPTRLAQVFSNLLNNAAKFTERGGRITLTTERQGSEVAVTVQDTGIGIDPELLPRLFDLFTQGDRSLERSQGGLGIGLALAHGLVELHGGRIEARSADLGQGSEFIVRLPLTVAPAPAAVRPTAAAGQHPPHPAGSRILVVDDNEDAAASLGIMLQLMGHDIQIAHDGLEALAGAETWRPAVIFLDLGMPKLNGYEAARRIRRQPWGKDTILIALTGWGQPEDRRLSQEAGFDHHFVKPVDLAELEKVLAGLLKLPV